jgi:hypothetical protein
MCVGREQHAGLTLPVGRYKRVAWQPGYLNCWQQQVTKHTRSVWAYSTRTLTPPAVVASRLSEVLAQQGVKESVLTTDTPLTPILAIGSNAGIRVDPIVL